MTYLIDYRDRVGSDPEKFYKTTLCNSPRLLLGLNCLEPGQTQTAHQHSDQDKFYLVVEGEGLFTLGQETHVAGPGLVIWAPANLLHGVTNQSSQRLVLLVGMAPSPAGS